jgi:hypothetical protein
MRPNLRRWRQGPLAGITAACAVAMAGCQTSSSQFEPIAADASIIGFGPTNSKPLQIQHFVQQDARSGTTLFVAELGGPDLRGVILAGRAGPGMVFGRSALETRVEPLLTVETAWRGLSRESSTGSGTVQYRLFDLVDAGVGCAGFAGEGGASRDDQHRRPNMMFGYICNSSDRPMEAAKAEGWIRSVQIGRR